MASIKDFLSNADPTLGSAFFQPEGGRQAPGSNYVAVALVDRAELPAFGAMVQLLGGGAQVALTVGNLVSAVKAMCFLGNAVFFGDGLINGKKGLPKEWEEATAYGSRTKKRTTGKVDETVDFDFSGIFLNVEFFNALRSRLKAYDVLLFTQESVQIVRFDGNAVTFHSIGHKIESDITKEISGSFSVSWTANGEIPPLLGILPGDLSAEGMRYTFGAYTTPVGVVPVPGQPDRFTLLSATGGSFFRTAVEPGTVSYQIFKNNTDPVGADPVTVDSVTGKVTIGTTLPNGRYTYSVVGLNTSGIFGRYTFSFDVKPA